jgi:hypothetical protein
MEHTINWTQLLLQGGIVVVPVLIGGWLAMRRLMWLLTEFRPHLHEEREGALHADGVRYPRSMNGHAD